MKIPFTVEEFLQVFANYNLAIWPMQIFLNLLGIIAIVFAIVKTRFSDKLISVSLAFFWLWIGAVYHLIFFTTINKAAYLFGVLNLTQGIIFLFIGVLRSKLSFRWQNSFWSHAGAIFIIYALLIYPLIGYAWGHVYPQSPTFGLPCPTTIFTFGLLLWTDKPVPKYALTIPFIWSLIGFNAALSLSIQEDFGLLIAGLLGLSFIIVRDRKFKMVHHA